MRTGSEPAGREDVDDPAAQGPLADGRSRSRPARSRPSGDARPAPSRSTASPGASVRTWPRKAAGVGSGRLQTPGGHDHPEGLAAEEPAEEPARARVLLASARIPPEGGVRYRHENDIARRLPLERPGEGAEIVESPEGGRLVRDGHHAPGGSAGGRRRGRATPPSPTGLRAGSARARPARAPRCARPRSPQASSVGRPRRQ